MVEILGRCGSLPLRERIGPPIGVLVLLLFIGVGIDAVIHPKRYMNSYLRSGGEMLRDLHEMSTQFVGFVFSCVSAWMLYELVVSVWSKCFG